MKTALFTIILFLSMQANASTVDSIQYRDGKVIIEEVIQVPKTTASQLYGKAKVFFSKAFVSSKKAIDSEDEANHTIIGKVRITDHEDQGFGGIYYNFTLTIQTKDERYRYTLSDITIEMTGLAPMTITAEKSAKAAKEKGSMEPMNDYYKKTEPLIALLKQQMISKDDNW